jgi:transposase
MTEEEELIHLRHENRLLREQVSLHQETIGLQRELISRQQEQITLLERKRSLRQEQLTQLSEPVKALQVRLAKNSHNGPLPPSSDRFSRQPKSLREWSGKKPRGQQRHRVQSLMFSACSDEVLVHAVERCEHCQADLTSVPPSEGERRQVADVP